MITLNFIHLKNASCILAIAALAFTSCCDCKIKEATNNAVLECSAVINEQDTTSEQRNDSSQTIRIHNSNAFIDSRDGKKYEYTKIGGQIWMSENLAYAASSSECYGKDDSNCTRYGRLYNWATAMNFPDSCNSNFCTSQVSQKHRGICPEGWHIPSGADWNELLRFIDSNDGKEKIDTTSPYPYKSEIAGKYLKATVDWVNQGRKSRNGTDNYRFAAFPGGYGISSGGFGSIGEDGYWWSTEEYNKDYIGAICEVGVDDGCYDDDPDFDGSGHAYYRRMFDNRENVDWDHRGKVALFSIRCIKDCVEKFVLNDDGKWRATSCPK